MCAAAVVVVASCGDDASSSAPHDTTCLGLCVAPSIDGQHGIVGGRFGYNSAVVNFSATNDNGGNAVARFWTTDPNRPLVVAIINGPSAGTMVLATGTTSYVLSGQENPLSSDASAALHSLNLTDAGQAIAQIPFAVGAMTQFAVPAGASDSDLQNMTTAAQETAKLRAALLLPLQLQAWFDPTFTTPTPAGYQSTAGLSIDDDGNPYVVGYWTLGDGSNLSDASYFSTAPDAARETGALPENVGASAGYNGVCLGTPQASYCRTACGSNCSRCTLTSTQVCNTTTMMVEKTDTYVCPTAPCCASHDNCYDSCKTLFNCGRKAAGAKWNWNRAKLTACMRACDAGCVATWGAVLCGMHIFGGGSTGTTTFTNTYSIGPCES